MDRTMLSVERTEPLFTNIRPSNPSARVGIKFEREVVKALRSIAGAKVEHNPWFKYIRRDESRGICSPDIIFWAPIRHEITVPGLIVIEVKHTWVPAAQQTLDDLYLPIVRAEFPNVTVRGLVIVKHLAFEGPKAGFTIRDSLVRDPPLLQWLGRGTIPLI